MPLPPPDNGLRLSGNRLRLSDNRLRPLDRWLAERMGTGHRVASSEELLDWQLGQVRDLVAHAARNSPFYGRRLAGVNPAAIRSLSDMGDIPTIDAGDLRAAPESLLCVSQDEIARVVTLQSSGTSGEPKRIFNTAQDLERTAKFFSQGMANLAAEGDTVAVLMPGDRPGGVGRLLEKSLSRMGARGVSLGPVVHVGKSLDRLLQEEAVCLVGSPAHVNLLACEWARRGLPTGRIRSALLCWDAVPDALARNVARIFGCGVFRHWGMVETGLGGAVECAPGSGMHLREADLLLEIVDPDSGAPVPDGEPGEMVATTLGRRGMPLIRYRTGDTGRILPGACPRCASPLRRLDPQVRRISDGVALGCGGAGSGVLGLSELNESLYAVPGLADFSASMETNKRITLRVSVRTLESARSGQLRAAVEGALLSVPMIRQAVADGLEMAVDVTSDGTPAVPGLGKRRLILQEGSVSE